MTKPTTRQILNQMSDAIEAFAIATVTEQQRHAEVIHEQFQQNDAPPLLADDTVATDGKIDTSLPRLFVDGWTHGDSDMRRFIDRSLESGRREQERRQLRDLQSGHDWFN